MSRQVQKQSSPLTEMVSASLEIYGSLPTNQKALASNYFEADDSLELAFNETLRSALSQVFESGEFDASYYLECNRDVQESGKIPSCTICRTALEAMHFRPLSARGSRGCIIDYLALPVERRLHQTRTAVNIDHSTSY